MKLARMAVGFVPFLLFTVLGYWLPVGWASAVGLVAALALIALTAKGGVKMLPVVQAAILLVFTLLGFLAGPVVGSFLAQYGRGIASLALGLVIVGAASFMPFTAQFARSAVPEAMWSSPEFLAVNRRISRAWGLAVVVVGICHIVGAFMEARGAASVTTLLVHWLVPILAFIRVIEFTKRTADTARPAPAA